jgi:hypothetical protein
VAEDHECPGKGAANPDYGELTDHELMQLTSEITQRAKGREYGKPECNFTETANV